MGLFVSRAGPERERGFDPGTETDECVEISDYILPADPDRMTKVSLSYIYNISNYICDRAAS